MWCPGGAGRGKRARRSGVEVAPIEGQAGKRQAKINHNFYAFFVRFWLHFASQLGPQNPPKSTKNRCSNRLPFCFCFLIVFWSVFAPKLASRKPKNHQKTIGFIMFFCKIGLPKLRSNFDPFLVPTWAHFASQNPPKTLQKPTPRGTKILIDFCIAFLIFLGSVLGAKLGPCWPHFRSK